MLVRVEYFQQIKTSILLQLVYSLIQLLFFYRDLPHKLVGLLLPLGQLQLGMKQVVPSVTRCH